MLSCLMSDQEFNENSKTHIGITRKRKGQIEVKLRQKGGEKKKKARKGKEDEEEEPCEKRQRRPTWLTAASTTTTTMRTIHTDDRSEEKKRFGKSCIHWPRFHFLFFLLL